MSFEINISNKTGYTLLAIVVLALLAVASIAYQNIPDPSHGADTILIDVEGQEMTLQDAVSILASNDPLSCRVTLGTTKNSQGNTFADCNTEEVATGGGCYQAGSQGDPDNGAYAQWPTGGQGTFLPTDGTPRGWACDSNNNLVAYAVCCGGEAVTPSNRIIESETASEGQTIIVSCSTGSIETYNSIYGTNCPNGGIPCSSCVIGDTSCTITYTNTACGGDPCGGVLKAGILDLICA